MFKVECPGCKASYNVDERRVPASTGMKMRCPKCTTTFQVKRPEEASGATPIAPAAPPPKPAAPRPRKATVIGLGGLAPGLPGAPAPTDAGSGEEDLLPAVVMPKGAAAPARAPAPAAPPSAIDELDLPVVAADLPAAVPARGARARTAAPPTGGIAVPDLDLDLPAPVGADLPAIRREAADLPAVRGGSSPAIHGGTDLPAVRGEIDLPAIRGGAPAQPLAKSGRQITGGVLFDDIDLPGVGADLPEARRVDLPEIKGDTALPAIKMGVDLPAIKGSGGFGEIDLPEVGAGLPTPFGASGLTPNSPPVQPPPDAGFGEDFDFDSIPEAPPKAPAVKNEFGGIGIPRAPSLPDFGAVKPPASPFGDAPEEDPFGPGPAGADPFAMAPPKAAAAPPPRPQAPSRQAGGGTDFGEVDLGGDGGDFSVARDLPKAPPKGATASAPEAPGWGERDLGGGDDDMEFEAIPQEKKDAPPSSESAEVGTSASVAPPSGTSKIAESRTKPQTAPILTPPKSSGKALRTVALLGLVVLLGGGSLTFTPFGAFGVNAITDAVKAKDYEALRTSTLTALRQHFAKDLATEAAAALQLAEANHASMPRATGVTVLAVYAAYAKELRFGRDSAQHAHANTLLATVPVDDPPPGYELAKAAQAAASDQLARGQNQIEAYLRRNPNDEDALALAAEIALLARDSERATAHWTKLAADAPSPRSLFGLARAHLLKKDTGAAREAAQKTLALEPRHVGALLLLASITWTTQRDEATTTKNLDTILKGNRDAASQEELIQAYTLAGHIHLTRSRVSAAEASFGEALKLSPKASGALDGMGEALFRAGRFAEALARFGSAMEADPEAVEPKIGVAKTKLALERLQEAKELMRSLDKKLRDEKKPDFRVLHWKGRVSEALGDKTAAEADYNEALKLAGDDPGVVDTYITLAQLLYSQGRSAEAQSKLDEARAKLPRSVPLFKALGDLASQAGRYTEAEAHYRNALQMDPQDISTRFVLGITLRRLAKFDAASEAFDKVTEADKDYPGLSLERAVLYEASGQSAKAVELYESALAKAPNDPDLMLRVAAALLAAQQPGPRAEELLRKVLQLRQNSAEANHFLGRALLVKGTNLAEALRYLRRATDLDPNRAEFFLYVGWAANEADDQQLASTSLAKALELDRSLADAYWQRGVLRRRQRALAEAEQDLLKALELRPSRFEAHATLAEVYEEQQKWPAAQAAWLKALAADSKRALWQFRLGKLVYQHGAKPASLDPLTKAVQLASQSQIPAPWMADACLLLGEVERAAGKKDLAIEHLQRFLSLAPLDSPYRADAIKALKALGVDVQ